MVFAAFFIFIAWLLQKVLAGNFSKGLSFLQDYYAVKGHLFCSSLI